MTTSLDGRCCQIGEVGCCKIKHGAGGNGSVGVDNSESVGSFAGLVGIGFSGCGGDGYCTCGYAGYGAGFGVNSGDSVVRRSISDNTGVVLGFCQSKTVNSLANIYSMFGSGELQACGKQDGTYRGCVGD